RVLHGRFESTRRSRNVSASELTIGQYGSHFVIDSPRNWSYQLVRPYGPTGPRRESDDDDGDRRRVREAARRDRRRDLPGRLAAPGRARAVAPARRIAPHPPRGAAPTRRVEPRRAAARFRRGRAPVSGLVDRSDRALPPLRQARARAAEHRADLARPARHAAR